jgi:hypothetical protein
MNMYLRKIGNFSTQINTAITSNEGWSQAVRYNQISLYVHEANSKIPFPIN